MPINFVIAHTLYRLLTTKACLKLTDKDLPFVRPDRILHNGSIHTVQNVAIFIGMYTYMYRPRVLHMNTQSHIHFYG